jgi:hypothetical protein
MQSIQVRPSTTGFPRSATRNDPGTGSGNDFRVLDAGPDLMRAGGQRFAETALLLGMTLQQASPLGIWSLAIPATGNGVRKWGQFLILICKALKATLLAWLAS